ncbi:unnamed protein product, partial [Symbiodinium pilosum]
GYLASLPERPVEKGVASRELRSSLGGPLPEVPTDARIVIDELAETAEQGLIASGGPRYFGYAIGGSFPVSLAADWLVSAWDQNAPYY